MALFINGVGQDTFSMNGVSVDNLYVDGVLVWSSATDVAPIYELIEPLVTPGDGFSYLFNSASSGSQFNGKLLTSTDTAWTPTAQEYPGDETAVIDLGTNKIDTQWTPPQDEVYTFTFIYDVVMGTSYSMCSIVPNGDGLHTDVYYDGVLAPRDTYLLYTPPLTSVEIDEGSFYKLVPKIPICTIEMSQYTFGAGDTATVTFTWDTLVVDFTLSNGVHAQNGEVTNLVQDTDSPLIYTATFTPDADVNDDTNILVVNGTSFNIHDQWGNGTDAQYESDNYTVNTSSFTPYDVFINWDDSGRTPSGGEIANTIATANMSDAPANYVDSLGNPTGISTVVTSLASCSFNIGTTGLSTCFEDDDNYGLDTLASTTYGSVRGFTINLPEGTFTIKVLSLTGNSSATRVTTFSLTGQTSFDIQSSTANQGSHCGQWTDVAGNSSLDFGFVCSPDNAHFNAMKITRTA